MHADAPPPGRRAVSGAGLVAIAGIAACLLLGVLVASGATVALDAALVDPLAALRDGPAGPPIALWERLGDLDLWLPISIVLGALLFTAGRPRAGLWMLLAWSADLLAYVVKVVFALPRPEGADLLDLFGAPSFAYPSGHVIRAFVVLAILALALDRPTGGEDRPLRRAMLVTFVLAGTLLMGIARVSAREHWPSDVLGALLLGVGWLGVVAWLDGRVRPRFLGKSRDKGLTRDEHER